VNKANTARTLAWHDARVFKRRVVSPAKSATGSALAIILKSYNWLGFFQFLLVELIGRLTHLLTLKVLYPKLYSA